MAPTIAAMEFGIDRQERFRPLGEDEIFGNIMLQRQGGRGMIMKFLEAASMARDINDLSALKEKKKGEGTHEKRVLLDIYKYISAGGSVYLWGRTFEPDNLVKRYPEQRLDISESPKAHFFAELDNQIKGINNVLVTQLAVGIPGVPEGSLLKVGIYEVGTSVNTDDLERGFERMEALSNLEQVKFED